MKGLKGALVDYYVSALDKAGNRTHSPLLHVYVGTGAGPDQPVGNLTWSPTQPGLHDRITFTADRPGKLHWGVNGWTLPPTPLWPTDTVLWPDNKAVETPMKPDGTGKFSVVIGPCDDPQRPVKEIDVVVHYADQTWGRDAKIVIGRD